MPEKKINKEKSFYIGGAALQRKRGREKRESVGAPSTSIITKLATYKDVCCTEAKSVEDPSLANKRRWK